MFYKNTLLSIEMGLLYILACFSCRFKLLFHIISMILVFLLFYFLGRKALFLNALNIVR